MKINYEKNDPLPPILEDSSAASLLKIWDFVPPYLKTLFEKKTRKLIMLTIFAYIVTLKFSINIIVLQHK